MTQQSCGSKLVFPMSRNVFYVVVSASSGMQKPWLGNKMHRRAWLVPRLPSVKRHTLYIADLMFWRMLDSWVHLMIGLDAFLSINRFTSILVRLLINLQWSLCWRASKAMGTTPGVVWFKAACNRTVFREVLYTRKQWGEARRKARKHFRLGRFLESEIVTRVVGALDGLICQKDRETHHEDLYDWCREIVGRLGWMDGDRVVTYYCTCSKQKFFCNHMLINK